MYRRENMESQDKVDPSRLCPSCGMETPEHTDDCPIGQLQNQVKANFKTGSVGSVRVLQDELDG